MDAAVTLLNIIVLAVVQGITEFLPISSSAHLILVPQVFGWPDQGVVLDVAVHVGTLLAVIIYFWRDVQAVISGFFGMLVGRRDGNVKLALLLAIGSLPVILIGYLLNSHVEELRDIRLLGWTTLVFGIILYLADRFGSISRRLANMHNADAVMIGLAQVLALVPGTSRSGITMTVARALGIGREDAARFSLLLSIPTIIAAGALEGFVLYQHGNAAMTGAAVTGMALSFVTALAAIALMMAWLRRATFGPFVVYRVILGVILLAFGYNLV
jgi:undecaprenyl-diphosphatase